MNRFLPLLLAAPLAACASAPSGGPPPAPPGIDPAHLHFAEPAVKVGDLAPDFTLPAPDGLSTVTLSALRGRPVVLVFGSFT